MGMYFHFCLFLYSLFTPVVHEFAIAHYDIKMDKEGSISVECRVDKEQYADALQIDYDNLILNEDILEEFERYFSERFEIRADNNLINMTASGISSNKLFYSVVFRSTVMLKDVPSVISVSNSCFLETKPAHSNIVTILIDNNDRMFRMHENRKKISVIL